MAEQRYYVVGGEYADTGFNEPARGTQLETYGPFKTEREAKVRWRELTGKTVDNAMVRYFLKSADVSDTKIHWVVGGEYADFSFTHIAPGKELQVFGPFGRSEAVGFWRGLTSKSVDDALVRYDIRENYDQGESGGTKMAAPAKANGLQPTATKSIAIAADPARVIAYLMNADNWLQWTSSARNGLKVKGDAASGVFDHAYADTGGNAWTVPGRVVPTAGGSVYVLVLTKPAAVTDTQFAKTVSRMDEELARLKQALEKTA
jgi:hypothetical protein